MRQEDSIETGLAATIEAVCRLVLKGAGLAVLRGGVGIGKSFALEQIAEKLEEEGVLVVMVTANEATAGNVNAFLRLILGRYHIDIASGADAEEAVWSMLAGHPFTWGGRRVLLIVDEAQKLAGRVLETIRGLWDRGDRARLGNSAGPAFGCVLVGNPTFMGKGGAQRTASFEPLISRLTHRLLLPTPSRAECQAYASTVFQDESMVKELAEGGVLHGNLRVMATAARSAETLAGDAPVTIAHLRQAFKMLGGK